MSMKRASESQIDTVTDIQNVSEHENRIEVL